MALRHLVILAAIVCSVSAQPATTLKGIVYSDHSGPSANGVGNIVLMADGKLYPLEYGKPYPQSFSTPNCRYAGSIWTVTADLSQNRLISSKCRGERDSTLYGSVVLIHDYIQLLKDAAYERAYTFLSESQQQAVPFEMYVDQIQRLDVSANDTIRSPYCLDIAKSDDRSVTVDASECALLYDHQVLNSVQFSVSRGKGAAHPLVIARMDVR